MAPQSRQPPASSGRAKVAIPRLERSAQPSARSDERRPRVRRACVSCRNRKIKCSGGQPRCQNCLDDPLPCIYPSSRRDRLKTMTGHNHDMVQLLNDIKDIVPAAVKDRIEQTLQDVTEDVADALDAAPDSLEQVDSYVPGGQDMDEVLTGEADVSAEVGSNEAVNMVDEDLLGNEASRATGYIGKNSEIQWLRRLHLEVDHPTQTSHMLEGPYGPPGRSSEADAERVSAAKRRQDKSIPMKHTSSVSYYLDDETIEMDMLTTPYEVPPFETAEKLLHCYMDTVHDTFPFLAKKTFVAQFYHYYASLGRGGPDKVSQKWQAIVNLVFAIGAVYSHLTQAEWRGADRDHLVYHSRAWSLTLHDAAWFSNPGTQQIQITSLLALYYLAIGHINRSWVIAGISLRSGYSLGLHVRNEERDAHPTKKEILRRIWWAVYTLEHTISSSIGRPSVGVEENCSVALPLPLSSEHVEDTRLVSQFENHNENVNFPFENQLSNSSFPNAPITGIPGDPPNSGSFLRSVVQVSMITQTALRGIYSASIASKSWANVQTTIREVDEELESWVSHLPLGLSFINAGNETFLQRERRTLALYYYGAKTTITRPCLCRLDRRIKNQTVGSNEFNRRTAEACVFSAKSIATLLPDIDDSAPSEIYLLGPWWGIVHYVMQASVVLLLEIAYESATYPHVRQDVFPHLKKLVRWLEILKTDNKMARRAHKIVINILEKMSGTFPEDISDLSDHNEAKEFPPPAPSLVSGHSLVDQQDTGVVKPQALSLDTPDLQNWLESVQDPVFDPPSSSQNFTPFQGHVDPVPAFEDFWNTAVPSTLVYPNPLMTDYDEDNPLSLHMGEFGFPEFPDQTHSWD
ncbi:hypothetical protein K491DRAFT_784785 [Lophiostoma macrostomum CBS 122681]|uniref:Zn(2)-C6 fungal-type domain-containing protein n=1 Tax=Lophiostoma macrostomum CBS 122681 TaxID=1314788 RepID=A0A6A6SHU6_9PLEO|nr:hypothetical protein K491DRAFT_784785 [Lophiostoma macrostomum CBS 122681]